MVNNDCVARIQIYLADEDLALLDRVASATGASRSALIRRAIRDTFGERINSERLRSLDASADSWKRSRINGASYVDSIRGDLNTRLLSKGVD